MDCRVGAYANRGKFDADCPRSGGQNEAIRAFARILAACRRITANTLSVRGSQLGRIAGELRVLAAGAPLKTEPVFGQPRIPPISRDQLIFELVEWHDPAARASWACESRADCPVGSSVNYDCGYNSPVAGTGMIFGTPALTGPAGLLDFQNQI